MIVVTGGTGLVGGHLLWHLLQQHDTVYTLCRPTSNKEGLLRIFNFYTPQPDAYLERIHWITADVLNVESLSIAFQNATEVYHCAAVVSMASGDSLMADTNVIGTRNVVEASIKAGVQKFCFVSSIAACGKAKAPIKIDENCQWIAHPHRSAYSNSKYFSEQEVWKGIERGLNAVIVNPGVILGVSSNNEGSAQLFAQVQKGLQFYTNGGTGYVDVQDVVKAMIQLMAKSVWSERFILVSENCSNKVVLNWIADGFDKPRPFIPIGKFVFLTVGFLAQTVAKMVGIVSPLSTSMARTATHRSYYSSDKIQKELNYSFKSIKQSIIDICTFTKDR